MRGSRLATSPHLGFPGGGTWVFFPGTSTRKPFCTFFSPPIQRSPSRVPAPPTFPTDALIRQVDSEAVILLGGGRALLMQVAHPLVAAAVHDHSDFATDPFGRLQRTLASVYTVVFGTPAQAARATQSLSRVHQSVTGPGYRADDPALMLWVHATLVDTAMSLHERFLFPLGPDQGERYYQEAILLGEAYGIPRDRQPVDLAAFQSYVRMMVDDLAGGMTEASRQLATSVLNPPLPVALSPLMAVARALTAGLLPAVLRESYGLPWTRCRQATLDGVARAARATLPRVPSRLRRVPTARIIRASGY
jgi:uncharacterized protein (DUF2236 family)